MRCEILSITPLMKTLVNETTGNDNGIIYKLCADYSKL